MAVKLRTMQGTAAGALVVLAVAGCNAKTSSPSNATIPSSSPASSPASPTHSAAAKVSAACQLLPVIKAQVAAKNYDVAQRDASHAESLASNEGALTETADFGTLALDLLDTGQGVKVSVVQADVATVTDDCK